MPKNKRPTWCHLLFYFTSYVLNMFRTLIYPSSGAWDYPVELPHWSYCSWFDVCWSFGVVVLEWYPCCRLQPATRIPLHSFWFLSTVPKYLNLSIFSKDLLTSFTLLSYLTFYWWETNIYVYRNNKRTMTKRQYYDFQTLRI